MAHHHKWRLLKIVIAALMVVFILGETRTVGAAAFFDISNIPVEASGATAVKARDKAYAMAQRIAFVEMLRIYRF